MSGRTKSFPALYKKSSKGKILVWLVTLTAHDSEGVRVCEQETITGDINGKLKESYKIHKPSKVADAWVRADGLVTRESEKKLARMGYFDSVEKAETCQPPKICMLLKNLDPNDIFNLPEDYFPCDAQLKLNGLRGTYYHDISKIMSRELKEFDELGWIRDACHHLCETGGYEYLDFELYVPGFPVNEIVSMVRHGDPKLKAWIFDVPGDAPWKDRLSAMKHLFSLNLFECIKFVSTETFYDRQSLYDFFKEAEDVGVEGIVVRKRKGLYKWNNKTTRNDTIFKVKPTLSSEFEITDIIHDALIIDGIGQRLIKFVCATEKGDEFLISPTSWGHDRRIQMYQQFIDGDIQVSALPPLSITFREWTSKGKPFHPIDSYLRDMM